MIEDYLLQVNKPARYIGQEWNVSRKNFLESRMKVAFCFPDLYEVGMSNLGLRIIYGILNDLPDVVCERVFSPGPDMESVLRANKLEIFSLESRKSLKEFDLLGFSLSYELGYTNVLNILDLGGIPLKAKMRDHTYPLVIGGGPCALNPEPMHEFFDFFLIGEAEDAIKEIAEVYLKIKDGFKAGKISKVELLEEFCSIEGVYVPSFYEVEYRASGQIDSFKPVNKNAKTKITKRYVKDLKIAYYPLQWIVPYIQIIHDRITLEVMRGCPNQCRFCQARALYFPLRLRDAGDILDKASCLYKNTGYEDLSLAGLSVSDYPGILDLLKDLVGMFKDKAVGISLPSIKPRDMVGNLATLLSSIKKTGLTFAPEAGSERLRNVLNKNFITEDFFKAIEEAFACGYQHVKLYFMIGLPSENEEDLKAIIDFANATSQSRKKVCQRFAQVNLSVNAIIPKPHTPMQWLAMDDMKSIETKQDYLKKNAKNQRLKFSFHNAKMSFLEGVLSRGDRRLSEVVLNAFLAGSRLDGWGEYFALDRWLSAFSKEGIDPEFYLRQRPLEEVLPWGHLDSGIEENKLKDEFIKMVAMK